MQKGDLMVLSRISQIIYDKKGQNILALDLHGISSITDYAIIAEGSVDRHVIAIAHAIEEGLKEIGQRPAYVEGLQNGDWVILDYVNVMVHLFMPGIREKYQLEQLWQKGEIVDVAIDVSPQKLSS